MVGYDRVLRRFSRTDPVSIGGYVIGWSNSAADSFADSVRLIREY